jgi:phosphonopyruvate decarboxylase
MQKGSVAAHALERDMIPPARHPTVPPQVAIRGVSRKSRPSRQEALRLVVAQTPADGTVLLATTGFCGRELYAIDDRPNQLYMVGSMGCILPFALGLALARPDLRVIALDGDGAALMRMGAFATAGAYGPSNLWHLLLDNGVHDSTGGQATVAPFVSFAEVAAACGYAAALESDDLAQISNWLDSPPLGGPRFARLLIRAGTSGELPRPSVTPVQVKTRLMQHFAATAGAH